MPNFKYRDTPDGIATLVEALRLSPLVKSVSAGDLLKFADTNITATTWISVEFSETVHSAAPVGLYKPRRKRANKGGKRTRQLDGYVYLLKAADGSYKIGKTVNTKSRKRTFDVRLPFKVEYVHTIETDDMHSLEKALHKQFAASRLRGSEFFALAPEDVQFIISLGSKCTLAQYTAAATIYAGDK